MAPGDKLRCPKCFLINMEDHSGNHSCVNEDCHYNELNPTEHRYVGPVEFLEVALEDTESQTH